MIIEKRLAELGLSLPELQPASGNFVHAVRVGSLIFASGKGSRSASGGVIAGKVGRDVTTKDAKEHARHIGLLLIAVLKQELGDLDKLKRIVKVLGLVNATPEYAEQPAVINGCSDLLVEVFGERGNHARSAIGAGSLPNNMTVEIELIAEAAD